MISHSCLLPLSVQGFLDLTGKVSFDNRDPLLVYAVHATEVDCPEGEIPLEWMLLTTEVVADIQAAFTILRWYSYRWRVEEYHKILKSGCQVERYRLAADGMKFNWFFECDCCGTVAVNLSTSYTANYCRN